MTLPTALLLLALLLAPSVLALAQEPNPPDAKKDGQSFGLTTSGRPGSGSYVEPANFCCPEYLSRMLALIRKHWDSRQKSSGVTVMKFTIRRDGAVTAPLVEKSSGLAVLDLYALRALQLTRALPPLPDAFTEPSLTVHLAFDYQR